MSKYCYHATAGSITGTCQSECYSIAQSNSNYADGCYCDTTGNNGNCASSICSNANTAGALCVSNCSTVANPTGPYDLFCYCSSSNECMTGATCDNN